MKRMACYFIAVLIILSLAGCGETESIRESGANSAAIPDFTAAPNVTSTPVPPSAPIKPTPPTPSAAPTPSPPRVFNVDDVKMQSTPKSTCFCEVGYDSDWEVLVVQFRDSGSVYTYSDFPEREWNEFIAADSLGSWYNTYIKGQYDCERIS